MKIYAPNADYTGVTAGVAFAGGVGELVKEEVGEERYGHLKSWFAQRGFGIGSRKDANESLVRPDGQNLKGTTKPFAEMTREELNEVALGKGVLGAADMKNKEEVIAAIQEAGGADTED